MEKKQKILRGNTSGRPITEAAQALGRILPAPEWMCDDQKEIWREVIRHAPRNVLTRVDAGVLTTYVVHRHAFESLAQAAEGNAHHLAKMADSLTKHQAAMLKASQALGLDPAARARLRMEVPIVTPSKSQSNLFDALKEA